MCIIVRPLLNSEHNFNFSFPRSSAAFHFNFTFHIIMFINSEARRAAETAEEREQKLSNGEIGTGLDARVRLLKRGREDCEGSTFLHENGVK